MDIIITVFTVLSKYLNLSQNHATAKNGRMKYKKYDDDTKNDDWYSYHCAAPAISLAVWISGIEITPFVTNTSIISQKYGGICNSL